MLDVKYNKKNKVPCHCDYFEKKTCLFFAIKNGKIKTLKLLWLIKIILIRNLKYDIIKINYRIVYKNYVYLIIGRLIMFSNYGYIHTSVCIVYVLCPLCWYMYRYVPKSIGKLIAIVF